MRVWNWLFSFLLQWDKIEEMLGEMITAVLICVILFALLQCFTGYKIRKIWTAIEGLLVFGAVAASIAAKNGMQNGVIVAIAAGAGLAGGLLSYFLWIVGGFFRVLVFLFAVVGAIFASKDLLALGLIIGLAAGLIGGILQAAFNRPFMIAYTAAAGGSITAFCLSKLIPEIANPWFLPIIIGSVLALLGIVAQVLFEKSGAKKSMATVDGEEAAIVGRTVTAGGTVTSGETAIVGEIVTAGETVTTEETNVAASREDILAEEMAGKEEPASENMVAGNSIEDVNVSMADANVPASSANATVAEPEMAQALEQSPEQETVPLQKKFCPKCGAECKPGTKFCMKCGQKL